MELNTSLLSEKLKEKRSGQGLRETAKIIGNISASTLSRIEQGKIPDIQTFFRLCDWLEVPSDIFASKKFVPPSNSEIKSTEKPYGIHFRAEKELSPYVVNSLFKMINLAAEESEK